MQPFTAQERAAISDAITRAEQHTSGEIVVVVARASAGYRAFALMCAALIALAVPLPLIHFTKWPVEYIYLLQLIVFAVGAGLSQWGPLRIAITPSSIKRTRAHQRAVEQFLAQNLYTTKGHTGVLIYVSAAERYAEVIADEGIYKKVEPKVWDKVIAELTRHIGTGTRTEGFITAIDMCGAVLAEHFPPGHPNKDELSNHLIVLDAGEPA
jgi:putative membrane protein